MPYNDLREWIAALERRGELKRIRAEVDPILEITEITDRVSKTRGSRCGAGGAALLFENVKGYPGSQVLINQFGTARRMNMALGVESLDEVADRLRQFMDVKSPEGFIDKLKMLPMLADMGKFFPKTVSHRSLQGGHQARQLVAARFPDPAMLAEGRWTIHHSAMRDHARPANRQAQCRHIPHAGL